MSVFHNNALIGSGAGTGAAAAAEYVIPKSLRFNSGDSAYLSKTPSSAGNRRTWTWSGWVKRAKLGDDEAIFSGGASNPITTIRFSGEGSASPDGINIFHYAGSFSFQLTTTAQYRDLSSWYHIVVALDTTQATASNRLKLYVNGEQVTAFDTETYPSQNFETEISNTSTQTIARNGTGSNYKNGYLADIQFVDGQALAPTDFGETRSSDGVWVPKEYTFGTNPNNGTTWSTGASVGQGTFLEPGSKAFNGNLSDSAAPYDTAGGGGTNPSLTLDFSSFGGIPYTSSVRVYRSNGQASNHTISINGGTAVNHPWNQWFTVATGSGTLNSLTSVNNNSSNTTGIAAVEVDGYVLLDGARDNSFHLNFSDSSTNEALGFDSAPTTPDPDPKKGMDVITYTGTYATLNVGGLQFEPGLVWIKNRDSGSSAHFLADSVRGGTKVLQSNSTGAENTRSNHILSFNPDGFTLGADGTSNYPSGNSFVAWVWRAGGPAVANSDGTITSQVSANTDYGFSIVTYTGGTSDATIGHGLGQTPKFYIVKARESTAYTDFWSVYHTSLGESAYIKLNENSAATTGSTIWNSTAPTTALFSVDATSIANENNTDYVAYVWSEVSGYSKFGSYTGNGSSTGPVITTGFKVRWLLVKRTDSTGSWVILDNERNTTSSLTKSFYAETSEAEYTPGQVWAKALSDGFQPTATYGEINASGGTYIYIAFADRPGNNWDVNNIVTNEGLTTSKTQFDVVTYTGNGGTNIIGGVVYSAGATATGGFEASNPAANGFNGTLTAGDRANGVTVGGTIEIVFSPGLSVSSTVGIWSGKSGFKYQINDSGSYTSVTNATEQWHDASFSGTLTNLKIQHTASNEAPGFSGIRVDGSTLIDGDGGPGLKFQPDFLWIKSRSNTEGFYLANSVSGLTKNMRTNATSAEQTNTNGVTAADANGFTLGDSGRVNGSSQTYVAWAWKAGGTAVSNTDGSITSSVSANAEYGFSVVTYTGTGSAATVGHGLNGKVPELIIVKNRDAAYNWAVWSSQLSSNAHYLFLNSTDGESNSYYTYWNNTAPTGSVFSVGANSPDTAVNVNKSGDDMVAYCFANVPGYQRIGSYTGNGSTTGPVVVTGFKPRFLLIKNVSLAGSNWFIFDSERSPSNPVKLNLKPNSSATEETDSSGTVDFDQNGFQIKSAGTHPNGSGNTIIYLAIGDDEIGSDEDCLVDVPNAVTADADATDTTGGYQRGNYATLNPLHNYNSPTYANGNLEVSNTSTGHWKSAQATIGVTSGKWYWESTMSGASQYYTLGVAIASEVTNNYTGSGDAFVYDGRGFKNGPGVSSVSYGATYTSGDTIGVALDLDAGTLVFYKNGVSQGTAFSTGLTDKTLFPQFSVYYTSAVTQIVNFGQMRFKYSMPTGYSTLNTTALPAATISDGSAHFEARTYTANATARSLTGYEFGPDWLWFKPRNVQGSHNLYDTVRGATKGVRSHATDAEYTDAQTVTSFNSDGFSLGTDSGGYQVNYSNNSMVVWAWNAGANSNKTYTVKVVSDSGNKYRFDDFGTSAVTLDLAEGSTYIFDQSDSSNAGHPIRFGTSANGTDYTTGVTHTGTPGSAGAKTTLVLGTGVSTLYYSCQNHSGMGGQINTNSTAGASNFDGSIQTTVKANPEAGFSIVTASPSNNAVSMGHGLNAAPSVIISKSRTVTYDWNVFHASLGGDEIMRLNTTAAKQTVSGYWNNVGTSTFSVASGNNANNSGNMVYYCFAPVAGYSAMGTFVGNYSADGPFVYTGFRPAFLMWKNTTNSGFNWGIIDSTRGPINYLSRTLNPNATNSESGRSTADAFDFLSNGFKVRASGSNARNQNGSTFIWMAFAENPFSANGGLAR